MRIFKATAHHDESTKDLPVAKRLALVREEVARAHHLIKKTEGAPPVSAGGGFNLQARLDENERIAAEYAKRFSAENSIVDDVATPEETDPSVNETVMLDETEMNAEIDEYVHRLAQADDDVEADEEEEVIVTKDYPRSSLYHENKLDFERDVVSVEDYINNPIYKRFVKFIQKYWVDKMDACEMKDLLLGHETARIMYNRFITNLMELNIHMDQDLAMNINLLCSFTEPMVLLEGTARLFDFMYRRTDNFFGTVLHGYEELKEAMPKKFRQLLLYKGLDDLCFKEIDCKGEHCASTKNPIMASRALGKEVGFARVKDELVLKAFDDAENELMAADKQSERASYFQACMNVMKFQNDDDSINEEKLNKTGEAFKTEAAIAHKRKANKDTVRRWEDYMAKFKHGVDSADGMSGEFAIKKAQIPFHSCLENVDRSRTRLRMVMLITGPAWVPIPIKNEKRLGEKKFVPEKVMKVIFDLFVALEWNLKRTENWLCFNVDSPSMIMRLRTQFERSEVTKEAIRRHWANKGIRQEIERLAAKSPGRSGIVQWHRLAEECSTFDGHADEKFLSKEAQRVMIVAGVYGAMNGVNKGKYSDGFMIVGVNRAGSDYGHFARLVAGKAHKREANPRRGMLKYFAAGLINMVSNQGYSIDSGAFALSMSGKTATEMGKQLLELLMITVDRNVSASECTARLMEAQLIDVSLWKKGDEVVLSQYEAGKLVFNQLDLIMRVFLEMANEDYEKKVDVQDGQGPIRHTRDYLDKIAQRIGRLCPSRTIFEHDPINMKLMRLVAAAIYIAGHLNKTGLFNQEVGAEHLGLSNSICAHVVKTYGMIKDGKIIWNKAKLINVKFGIIPRPEDGMICPTRWSIPPIPQTTTDWKPAFREMIHQINTEKIMGKRLPALALSFNAHYEMSHEDMKQITLTMGEVRDLGNEKLRQLTSNLTYEAVSRWAKHDKNEHRLIPGLDDDEVEEMKRTGADSNNQANGAIENTDDCTTDDW